jgi:hypothetical protein
MCRCGTLRVRGRDAESAGSSRVREATTERETSVGECRGVTIRAREGSEEASVR